MNIHELTTWNRLLSLDFSVADAAQPFSARLARDNGWSRTFALRVIEEYRKFCFLAVHAGHPVTPSDEVDQVWHLHLLYSRHYWDALCRATLEKPLHHGPTRGGAAEDRKFHDWYGATLASYRRHFGEPPKDVWPSAGERFHPRNDFVRINRRNVLTLDRTWLRRGALASIAGGGLLAIARAVAEADGTGAPTPEITFVVVLAAALIAVLAVAAVRRSRRDPGTATGKRSARDGAVVGGAAGCSSSSKAASGDGNGADGGSSGCGGGGAGCGGGG